jgi:tripartite-type tricarboxylate transporter receptor subunit TctC
MMIGVLAFGCASASAQTFPDKPIRIVVPAAPVGSMDVMARVVGQRLTESWGQPVIIDNRPGAGGTTAADLVAKARPDGYTLLIGSMATIGVARAMYPNLPYDPLRDFEHVGLWVTFPLALVVPASSPIASLRQLIEHARARPGELRYGSQGLGTSAHVFAELMNTQAGIKVISVPYKGGGPALMGVLVGEVDYSMIALPTALTQVGAGKARVLAVTSAAPAASFPAAPPIATVVPGYEALNFHGLHAPANTPRAIVRKLHAETTRILLSRDVKEKLQALAMDIPASSPDQYRAFVKAEIEKWTPLVKASGAHVD